MFSKIFKSLVVSLILFSSFNTVAKNNEVRIQYDAPVISINSIDNGWYVATVSYYNSKTFYRSTYTLNVYVEYNSVTKIDFGDGGSVHSGYNNSGYMYTGGYLSINKDYSGNIQSATTNVTVSYYDPYYTQTFDITIK